MDIKGSALYNKDTMKKFLRFNMFKGRFYRFTPFIYGVLVVFFVFFAIMYQLGLGFQWFMTLAIVILVAAYLVQIISFYVYPNAKMKKRDDENPAESFYLFKESAFEFSSKTSKEKQSLKYESLMNVYETKEFFYLYINKKGAFILDKKTLEEGQSKELASLFKKAKKGLYIKCL